jgi:hypothetical protein
MKYVVTWGERPGSYTNYEMAQKRVLSIFQKWSMQESLTFHQFLVRVGEFGGYAVLETDNGADVHKLITAFGNFQVRLEPVLEVREVVAAEADASAWRASTTALAYTGGKNSGKERMIRTKADEDRFIEL